MQLARIDGDTSESELQLIREIGASKYVTREEVDQIMNQVNKETTIPSLDALSDEEKIELITNLVMVMKADGRIELREMNFCFDIIKKVSFSETLFINLVVGVFDQGRTMEEATIRKYVQTGMSFS
jgi:uncharacterized tellurite resistance protein B-like protein